MKSVRPKAVDDGESGEDESEVRDYEGGCVLVGVVMVAGMKESSLSCRVQ